MISHPFHLIKKHIIGNWKLYLDYKTSLNYALELQKQVHFAIPQVRIVICPSFPCLAPIYPMLDDLFLGAQNVSMTSDYGAYTGQINAKMLKQIGCSYVIIGHSEVRKFLKEDNEEINQKFNLVLENQMTPILCVGETWEQRESGQHYEVVEDQLKTALKGAEKQSAKQPFLIAYEPVWAIGTDVACEPGDVLKIHVFIAEVVRKVIGDQDKKYFGVLYGGSVDSSNFLRYMRYSEVEGVLMGGASVKIKEFCKIVESIKKQEF